MVHHESMPRGTTRPPLVSIVAQSDYKQQEQNSKAKKMVSKQQFQPMPI
jgi:hypothetical protein